MKANALTVLALIGIVLQFISYGQHAPVFYGLHFFLLGALARRHTDDIESVIHKIANPPLWFLYVVTFVIIFFAIPNELYIGSADEHAHNTVGRLFYPVIMAALIPLLHERTKSNKIDTWIGHLSYPFYLVHTLVIALFSIWESVYKAPVLLILCIGVSAIFVMLEMKYVDPWRSKFAKK
ncbi:MAG: acyltransferase family protein [Sideroxydans sp.]|nr:acyltransferase family protein [Sideroxydans sp.]